MAPPSAPQRASTAATRVGASAGGEVGRHRDRASWRVWLRRVLSGLLLVTVFLATFVAALILHAGTPPGRRALADGLTSGLSALFQGQVTIGRLDAVGLRRVVATELTVRDPEGAIVLEIERLRVHAQLPVLAYRALLGVGRQTLVIDHVRADGVRCALLPDADTGVPSIARAFTPYPRTTAPSAGEVSTREIRVWLGAIEIGRGSVQGEFAGLGRLEAELAAVQGTVLATERGAAIDVARFGVVLRGLGAAAACGTGELHVRAPGRMWSSFDGFVGEVGFSMAAELKGQVLEARVDLPRVRAAAMREIWAPWPFVDDAEVHVEAHGELPSLAAQTTVRVGAALLRGDGQLRLAGDFSVRADLEAQHLDLRSLGAELPETDIGINAQLVLFEGDEGLVARVNGITTPAVVDGIDVPATDLTGALVSGRFGAKATLHERGIPIKIDLEVERDGAMELRLQTRSFRLQRAPRIAAMTAADGVAELRITGKVLGTELDAVIDGSITGFTLADVAARQASVTGRVRGSLADPSGLQLDLRVRALEVGALGGRFAEVELDLEGPVRRVRAAARLMDPEGPSFELSGLLEPLVPRASGVSVAVTRDGARLEGELGRVDVGPNQLVIEGLTLRGAGGELALEARIDAERVAVAAQGERVDLARVARLLGLPEGVLAGSLVAADVDLELDGGDGSDSQGRVALELADVSVSGLDGIALRVDGTLAAGRLESHVELGVPELGGVVFDGDTRLAGAPLDPGSWLGVTGVTELRLIGLDLDALSAWLAPHLGALAFSGRASGALRLAREDAELLPDVTAVATTEALTVRHGDGEYRGVDVGGSVQIAGETGLTEVSASLGGLRGILATGSAELELDLPALLMAPEEYAETLLATRGQATIHVPARGLDELPELVPELGVGGSLGGRLELAGTLGDPVVVVHLSAHQLRALTGAFQAPLDGNFTATVRPRTGGFGAHGDVRYGGDRIAHLALEGTVPLDAVWSTGPAALADATGIATVRFLNLPLGMVPVFSRVGVQGAVRGAVVVERSEGAPQIRGGLDFQQLTVAGASVGTGHLLITPSSDRLSLEFALDEGARVRGERSGSDGPPLAVALRAGLAWREGIPGLDPTVPVEIQAQAQALDARVLAPVVRDVLAEITGRLDGRVHVTLRADVDSAQSVTGLADGDEPGSAAPVSEFGDAGSTDVAAMGTASEAAERLASTVDDAPGRGEPVLPWRAEVEGALGLADGVVQVVGLGLELRGFAFDARARVIGEETVIHVTRIEGMARSSAPNLVGWAELRVDGEGLAGGKGRLDATEMPLPVGGISLATVTGATGFELTRKEDEMRVDVAFERMVARVPPSATRTLHPVTDEPAIQVQQPLRETSRARAADASPWHLSFDLGEQTHVVMGDFEIPVSGQPEIRLADETQLSGYVDLEPGGRLPLLGKTFRVVSGRIWLDPEDVANPRLNVTASWRAPEATIYVRVQGRWANPSLVLESEPPYSEEQIFVLLLGGSLDDASASQEGIQLQAAYGAAQVLGVNQLFAGTALSQIEVSPDTSAGTTRYRASYRVSDRVRLEGIYQPDEGGVAAETEGSGGSLDDSRRRDAFAAAVELGLGQGWFLRTEAGNASAEFDLVWQYRY